MATSSGARSLLTTDSEIRTPRDPYRQVLQVSLGAILKDIGFGDCEHSALESLTEMLQGYIAQLGKSTKVNSEVANRTQVMVADVSLALVESGCSLPDLKQFIDRRVISHPIPPLRKLETAKEPSKNRLLHVKQNAADSHPNYIPDHLPSFPDKHTYIDTPAQRATAKEYQEVREKAANQKREMELALTKLIAQIGNSNSYSDDPDNPLNTMFPLIACKPTPLSYLSALLPPSEDHLEAFDLKLERGVVEEPPAKLCKKDKPAVDNPVKSETFNLQTDMDIIDVDPY